MLTTSALLMPKLIHFIFWGTVRWVDSTSSLSVGTWDPNTIDKILGFIITLNSLTSRCDDWFIKILSSVEVFRKKLEFHRPENLTQGKFCLDLTELKRSVGWFFGRTTDIISIQFGLEMKAVDFLKQLSSASESTFFFSPKFGVNLWGGSLASLSPDRQLTLCYDLGFCLLGF